MYGLGVIASVRPSTTSKTINKIQILNRSSSGFKNTNDTSIQADFKFVTFEPIPYNKSAHIMYKTRYVSQIQDLVQLKMPM